MLHTIISLISYLYYSIEKFRILIENKIQIEICQREKKKEYIHRHTHAQLRQKEPKINNIITIYIRY